MPQGVDNFLRRRDGASPADMAAFFRRAKKIFEINGRAGGESSTPGNKIAGKAAAN